MKHIFSVWANVADMVGAVAIIVSLIYVSIQVRDNTNAIKSAATNDAATAVQEWYMVLGSSEQTSKIFYNGMTKPESLTNEQMFQFMMIAHAGMLGFQNAFELAEQGTLDPEIRDSITNTLAGTKDLPGYKIYWQQRGSQFNPQFREFIEDLNARPTPTSAKIYQAEEEDSGQ